MNAPESMQSLYQVWIYTMDYLQNNYDISEAAIDMWISCLTPKSIEKGIVTLEINTDFQKDIVEQQYGERLRESFSHVLGFEVSLNIISIERKPNIEPTPADDQFGSNYFFNRTAESGEYTFENFIVGSSNRFAHAAAVSVASNPAVQYNPLFIYGNSGLGKTHLLYAVCAALREKNPQLRVIYTKCEEMTNDYINALGVGQEAINEFRATYRQADILLIDDIQFLAGKIQTQEEFFHTFDYLYNAGRQIILTSDRPPREIATLSDRLRGRFEQGLLADIQAPDLETRIAIIKRKAFLLHMHISDDVCEYIATQLKDNVRQLEGVVKTMHAQYLIGGNSPTLSVAQNAIRDIRSNNQPTPVTIDRIISEVSRTFNVSVADIRSKSRTAQIARARQVAFFVVRSITGLKQEEIGQEFGGFDHTTVLYSLRKVDSMMQTDPSFKNTVNDIIRNLSEN